jgi:hypothetical protein
MLALLRTLSLWAQSSSAISTLHRCLVQCQKLVKTAMLTILTHYDYNTLHLRTHIRCAQQTIQFPIQVSFPWIITEHIVSAQRGTAAGGTSASSATADSSTAATAAAAAGGAQSASANGSATAGDAAIDSSTNGLAKKRKKKKGAGESLLIEYCSINTRTDLYTDIVCQPDRYRLLQQ